MSETPYKNLAEVILKEYLRDNNQTDTISDGDRLMVAVLVSILELVNVMEHLSDTLTRLLEE